ncbi:uncharacterized protein LOC116346962 isoform X2 [Contarinia nasturtii]|uniref:uncharacterized protein LOC116346962 isoform X2 n=1 Tax=Contarinia nasturtii TaxID=265458 RepID=UPI0012D3FD29|nr:uncharacterized protein LOC116346962 isoform X2 [Contarinia nasturtii]
MTINHKIQNVLMRLRSFQLLFIWCICLILFVHTDSHQRDFGDITTARGLYYTFGLKTTKDNVATKNYRNYADRSHRYTIAQLKNQIKFVLNLGVHTKNESIDKYIYESFNVFNPDPVYVFVLPSSGDSNRTLVFRRSNFSDISFPNTTSLQTIQKILKSSKYAHLFPSTDDIASKQLALGDKFFTNYKQFMSSESDLHEAESLKIVEENVRTEKNFFKFMDRLNEERASDLSDSDESASIEDSGEQTPLETKYVSNDYRHGFIKEIHSKDHVGNYELAKEQDYSKVEWPKNDKLSWDDFGLHGWIGNINDQHENPQENGFIPILSNYDPLALLTTTTTTFKPYSPPTYDKLPPPIHQFSFVEHNPAGNFHVSPRPRPPPIILSSMHQPTQNPVKLFIPAPSYLPIGKKPSQQHSHRKPFKLDGPEGTWDVRLNISKELLDLLIFEKIKLGNFSNTLGSKSKWVVTTSRLKHRDDDVFVARANNPFGHSTKWKLSIASQNDISKDESDDDGRQKRDVLDLYSMVKCATGCDPLIFKGYGCYCGFLGSGKALDGIDRCCKMHDYCYHAANCPKFLEYFVPYLWKCYRGRPLCAIEHGEWGGKGSCSATLCECDRALSNCLRRFYCPRKRAVCSSSPLRLLQNILMDV